MLVATSPRLSSEQEKNNSTEEAYPAGVCRMSSRCTGIYSGRDGDTQTCEDDSRNMPTSQSAYEHMTELIANELPIELSKNRQIIRTEAPVTCNSMKPRTMQSDTHNHTKKLTESQGEEFLYYIQYTGAQSEDVYNLAAHKDEFCKLLKTTVESDVSHPKTVQLEEVHSLVQRPTELRNPIQTSSTTLEHPSNSLQISCNSLKAATPHSEEPSETLQATTVHLEEPTDSLQTATVQSVEPFKSLQTATVQSEEHFMSLQTATFQSEEHFKSLQTATFQSERPCSFLQMPAAQSDKIPDSSQTENVYSVAPCDSLWTTTDQPEEFKRHLQTSTILSKKLSNYNNKASIQSLDLSDTKGVKTFQPDHYSLQQSAPVRPHDTIHTGQTVSTYSYVPHHAIQEASVQAEGHQTMETTEEQVDSTVHSGHRSSTHFAEPYDIKQAPAVHMEELFLSRTIDSHWSDSVTAYKVAVEGDLNG